MPVWRNEFQNKNDTYGRVEAYLLFHRHHFGYVDFVFQRQGQLPLFNRPSDKLYKWIDARDVPEQTY